MSLQLFVKSALSHLHDSFVLLGTSSTPSQGYDPPIVQNVPLVGSNVV